MKDDLEHDKELTETYLAMNKERNAGSKLGNIGRYDPNVIYWTVNDIAKALNTTRPAVQWHIKQGHLEVHKLVTGGKKKNLIHPDEAERFLKEKETKK